MAANGTEYTVFDFTIPDQGTAYDLFIEAGGKNSYSTTSIGSGWAWYFSIYIDGGLNNITGGSGAITDVVALFGAAKGLSTGPHEVKVTWSGHSGMTFINPVMNLIITKR